MTRDSVLLRLLLGEGDDPFFRDVARQLVQAYPRPGGSNLYFPFFGGHRRGTAGWRDGVRIDLGGPAAAAAMRPATTAAIRGANAAQTCQSAAGAEWMNTSMGLGVGLTGPPYGGAGYGARASGGSPGKDGRGFEALEREVKPEEQFPKEDGQGRHRGQDRHLVVQAEHAQDCG